MMMMRMMMVMMFLNVFYTKMALANVWFHCFNVARHVESYSQRCQRGPKGFMPRCAKYRYQTKSLNKIGYQKSNQNWHHSQCQFQKQWFNLPWFDISGQMLSLPVTCNKPLVTGILDQKQHLCRWRNSSILRCCYVPFEWKSLMKCKKTTFYVVVILGIII